MEGGRHRAKIGIVGTGYIGEIHIQAFQQNPLCELTAICDANEARLHQMQERYGVPRGYTTQEELHRREHLDGVVIATPDEHHRRPVELAAEAGVHIMLEKPIATTLEDAEAIGDAVARAGVTVMLGFTLRWIPQYVAIHDQVKQGRLGQVTSAFARRSCRYSEARRLYGRCTANQYLAVHDMDTLLWNLGRDVQSIYATAGNFVLAQTLGIADYYWNLITWKNGATGVVYAGWNEQDSYNVYVEMHLLLTGTEGSAHMQLSGQQVQFATATTFETPEISLYATYPAEADHFIRCILFNQRPLTGIQEGMDTLKLLLAAEQSVARGVPVHLEL